MLTPTMIDYLETNTYKQNRRIFMSEIAEFYLAVLQEKYQKIGRVNSIIEEVKQADTNVRSSFLTNKGSSSPSMNSRPSVKSLFSIKSLLKSSSVTGSILDISEGTLDIKNIEYCLQYFIQLSDDSRQQQRTTRIASNDWFIKNSSFTMVLSQLS